MAPASIIVYLLKNNSDKKENIMLLHVVFVKFGILSAALLTAVDTDL